MAQGLPTESQRSIEYFVSRIGKTKRNAHLLKSRRHRKQEDAEATLGGRRLHPQGMGMPMRLTAFLDTTYSHPLSPNSSEASIKSQGPESGYFSGR